MSPGIFISHSSRDDPAATALRRALADSLGERGYEILLDEARLDPGDVWRAKLYRWLAECEGGLLILTPVALQSDWVRKEVTILMWRSAVSESVRVIPIMVGVTSEEVEKHLPQLHVEDRQAIRVNDATEQTIGEAVSAVAERFADLGALDDAVRLWATKLAEQLLPVTRSALTEFAQLLSVDDSDWRPLHDVSPESGTTTLAHALLQGDSVESVEQAVREVIGEVSRPLTFSEYLAPLGVETNGAAMMLSALRRPPGDRIAVLNAQEFATAVRYLDRANCARVGIYKLGQPMIPVENAAESVCDAVRAALADHLELWPDASISEELARADRDLPKLQRRVLVLTARDGVSNQDGLTLPVLRATINALRTELPHLALVVLTGNRYPAPDLLDCPEAIFVNPQIDDPRQELRDNASVRRIRAAAGVA